MNKIWLQRYPAGVPETIDPNHFASLVDILEHSVETYGDRIAYVNMDHEMSFNALDEASKKFAVHLQQQGLQLPQNDLNFLNALPSRINLKMTC